MKKKKVNLGGLARGAEKAEVVLNKAKNQVINVLDQNDDGELTLKDVEKVADTLGRTAKDAAGVVKSTIDKNNRELVAKLLQPIFPETLNDADFLMPKLVRITEIDKKHAESEVCKGSIGHISLEKDLKVVNIYRNKIDAFNLSFYPDRNGELYYANPVDRDNYIDLDRYFEYLKSVRISELQKIAQDLGAKYFKVTLKEERTSFSNGSIKAMANVRKKKGELKATAKDAANLEISRDISIDKAATLEIAAEMQCPGQKPRKPDLRYLQGDPDIQGLIELRMNEASPLQHKKYIVRLSNTSGIKKQDAAKIDAAIKAMKFSGNATVTGAVESENRRFFEYEIEF